MDVRTEDSKEEWKNGRMKKMTEDNCRIGDQKVMTNTKGAPHKAILEANGIIYKQIQDALLLILLLQIS